MSLIRIKCTHSGCGKVFKTTKGLRVHQSLAKHKDDVIETTEVRHHESEGKKYYEGGSSRSVQTCRMDLVPSEGSIRTGIRYGLGAIKHGEQNWKKGGKRFIMATINHMELHMLYYKAGMYPADDHLGAIGWAQSALSWFEQHKPKEVLAARKELVEG